MDVIDTMKAEPRVLSPDDAAENRDRARKRLLDGLSRPYTNTWTATRMNGWTEVFILGSFAKAIEAPFSASPRKTPFDDELEFLLDFVTTHDRALFVRTWAVDAEPEYQFHYQDLGVVLVTTWDYTNEWWVTYSYTFDGDLHTFSGMGDFYLYETVRTFEALEGLTATADR